jgi:hypothetical protein
VSYFSNIQNTCPKKTIVRWAIRGRCYDHNFAQFSFVSSQKRQFFRRIFRRKFFLNHNTLVAVNRCGSTAAYHNQNDIASFEIAFQKEKKQKFLCSLLRNHACTAKLGAHLVNFLKACLHNLTECVARQKQD